MAANSAPVMSVAPGTTSGMGAGPSVGQGLGHAGLPSAGRAVGALAPSVGDREGHDRAAVETACSSTECYPLEFLQLDAITKQCGQSAADRS